MRRAWCIIGLALGLAASCSDDSTSTDKGVPDAGGDGVVGDQSVVGSLTVKVLQMDGVYLIQGFEANVSSSKAASGATVAADLPGGQRVEQTTGTDGTVKFTGVAWSKGPAAVTAYLKGYQMTSRVGVVQADGDQTLVLVRGQPPQTIKVSGAVKNADANATYLGVGASAYSWSQEPSLDTTYELDVAQGKAFSVIAVNGQWKLPSGREVDMVIKGWTKADHAGSTQAVTLDLDFATALTPVKVTGTFTMPKTGTVGTGSIPRGWSRQLGNSLILGICAKTTMQTNGDFNFEFEHVQPSDSTGVYTTYYAAVSSYGWNGSFITVSGFPSSGAQVGSNFLDVPAMTAPSDQTPMKRSSAIKWTTTEATATPLVAVRSPSDVDKTKKTPAVLPAWSWLIEGKPGSTTLTLPALPSTATAAEIFGSAAAQAQVMLCADRATDTQRCGRFSLARSFKIDPTL